MTSTTLKKKVSELEIRLSKVEQSLWGSGSKDRNPIETLRPLTTDNSIFKMVGIGASGKRDISSNKYKYLAKGKKKTTRRRRRK